MNKLIRYWLLMIAVLLSTSVMAGLDYKGFGGWRTYDQYGNPLPDSSGDSGYAKPNIGLSYCIQTCEQDNKCKGVEYVDLGAGNTNCEVHWDTFAYCDTRGGTKVTVGQDGCWVKTAPPTCPTQNWKWISFGVKGSPEIRVDSSNYLVADAKLSNNQTYEVTTHNDCTISLQSRQNSQYVRDGIAANAGHAMAIAPSLADAAHYIVHTNADQTYSFQHQTTQGWMFVDGAYWVRGNGGLPLNDPMSSHFKVTVHQTR